MWAGFPPIGLWVFFYGISLLIIVGIESFRLAVRGVRIAVRKIARLL